MNDDLVTRLKKRAEIQRQIPSRKSVQEGKPDRLADLLDEAASKFEELIRTLETDLIDEDDNGPWESDDWDYGYHAGIRRAIELIKGKNASND